MNDLSIVLAHFNTSRSSPFNSTWQETIFDCVKQINHYPVTFLDWGSTDGSNKTTEKTCNRLGYQFFGFPQSAPRRGGGKKKWRKLKPFSWNMYWSRVMKVVDKIDAEYILYIECDNYVKTSPNILEQYVSSMRKHGLHGIKMARAVADGIRPHWVKEQLDENSWLLPTFPDPMEKITYGVNHELISKSKKKGRCLWNGSNSQCMMLERNFLISSFKSYQKTKASSRIGSRPHVGFWKRFDASARIGLMDYLFSFNYGEPALKCSSKLNNGGKVVVDKYWNSKVSQICPESIIYVDN